VSSSTDAEVQSGSVTGLAAGPWVVVANPTAGGVSPTLVDEVVSAVAEVSGEVSVHWTTSVGSATEFAASIAAGPSAPAALVSVGGDGTARELAEGLARGLGRWPGGSTSDSGTALLVLPGGTGNSTARALWGQLPTHEVLQVIAAGGCRVRQLDLLRLVEDDRAVALGASSGLIADVTRVALKHTDIKGRERYHKALGEVLSAPSPYPGTITVDGTVLHEGLTLLATVGGGRHRVGTFEVLPRSVLDDGLLDVCVVDGALPMAAVGELAPHVMGGTHLGRDGVAYAQGRTVRISRSDGEPLPFESDGEVWPGGGTTVTLEIVPGAVPVLAPGVAVAG
jgi:diacylglycerol kinase (ATP)